MARYYNKTSGLLTVTLKDGSATVVPSKCWLPPEGELDPALDGSSDLRKKVNKGLLVRRGASAPAPAPAPAPEPVEAEEPVSAPDPETGEEEDPPSMDWRKDDLVAYAEGMDLDVSGMTKAQILEAIEGAA